MILHIIRTNPAHAEGPTPAPPIGHCGHRAFVLASVRAYGAVPPRGRVPRGPPCALRPAGNRVIRSLPARAPPQQRATAEQGRAFVDLVERIGTDHDAVIRRVEYGLRQREQGFA